MSSDSVVRSVVTVRGQVQGVGYRAFTHRSAVILGLVGGVRNLCDGGVEVIVEGRRTLVEQLMESLRTGPPLARVAHVHAEWGAATGEHRTFEVWRDR